MELVKYEAAKRALSEARTLDEVKEIANRAEAMRAYARQAGDTSLEIDAAEIRVRAERRLGDMLIEGKRQGMFRAGLQADDRRVTLKDIGITGNLSTRAQNLSLVDGNRFEKELSDWRDRSKRSERVGMPMQSERNPYVRADRERVKARRGRTGLDDSDHFARYVALDGRKMTHWRVAELARLESATRRQLACIVSLRSNAAVAATQTYMPVPPSATLLDVMDVDELRTILDAAFSETSLPLGETAITRLNAELSEPAAAPKCLVCGSEFLRRKPNSEQIRSGRFNLFCSRSCSAVDLHRNRAEARGLIGQPQDDRATGSDPRPIDRKSST